MVWCRCGVAFERLPVPISPDCNISCSKARAAALWNRQADPASSFPNRKYDEEEKSGRERPNFKRVYIGFHTTCRKCGQLTFDRSSILPHHTRIVQSLLPVFGRRSKDERRSGWGQNCFDTQQEKHDTGLAESSPKPLDLRISLLLPFWS